MKKSLRLLAFPFRLQNCVMAMGFVILTTSCTAHKKSLAVTGEDVQLVLLEHAPDIGNDKQALGPVLGLVIPQVIKWGVSGARTLIDKQAEKYTASYRAQVSGDDFYLYDKGSDRLRPKYRGFELNRTVTPKNGASSSPVLASQMEFDLKLNPEATFMSLDPKSLTVHWTKAKLNADDNTVDLLVSISISAIWTEPGNVFNNQEIARFEFPFLDIALDRTYGPDSAQILSAAPNWMPLPPVSRDAQGKFLDHGYFEINVQVVETDDYKKRLEKYSTLINNNQDLINALLNTLIGSGE